MRPGTTPLQAAALMVALFCGAAGTAAQEPSQRPRTWRVPGGEEALHPAAPVRLSVVNRVPSVRQVNPYGLVQAVAYLFPESATPAALLTASSHRGLQPVPPDPDFPSLLSRVSVEIFDPDAAAADVAAGIGRAVKVHHFDADSGSGTVRVDRAELEDRLRWSPDTLIPTGQERVIWEGTLPLGVNRVYADYLVVRSVQAGSAAGAGDEVIRQAERGLAGILDLPNRPTNAGGPTNLWLAVERSAGDRIHELELVHGRTNIIRLVAVLDATGAFTVEVETRTEPLRPDNR